MEPADQVQEEIRLQGVRLGPARLARSTRAWNRYVQRLIELVTPQMAAQPAPPAPPGLSPRHGSEPRLPAPERYEGDPGSEVFSKSHATSLPPHWVYDCAIDLLAGTSPPRGRLLSLSAPERLAMERYIGESLATGLIRPSSFSWGKRMEASGIDYRGLNAITVKNRYPIPLISSAFATLQKARFFTKLDLRNAYHLVRIREGDEWKTAFNTPRGHVGYTSSVMSSTRTSSCTWTTSWYSRRHWRNTRPPAAPGEPPPRESREVRVPLLHSPVPRLRGVQREDRHGPL